MGLGAILGGVYHCIRASEMARHSRLEYTMGDITMGLVILAFFIVCICYVAWCGRIIGPDPHEIETDSGVNKEISVMHS